MNVKKTLPLAVALVLGVISARMVVKIIQNRPGSSQAGQGVKLTKVMVAARDISAGEDLEASDLETSEITAETAPGATFSRPDDLVGRVALAPLVHGQALLESLLAPKGSAAGLQAVIPNGMRAITLEINETSGVAGYVTPGCHVDIDLTLRDDYTNQMIDRCLVQNVPVTAVGVRPAAGQDVMPGAHSVTLLVTPRQAEMIDLASANGRCRLVLRNGLDHATADLPIVTLAEITGTHSTVPAAQFSALPTTLPSDPFATTQPARQASGNDWRVRVITAGEQNLVDIRVPKRTDSSSITGTDQKDATAP